MNSSKRWNCNYCLPCHAMRYSPRSTSSQATQRIIAKVKCKVKWWLQMPRYHGSKASTMATAAAAAAVVETVEPTAMIRQYLHEGRQLLLPFFFPFLRTDSTLGGGKNNLQHMNTRTQTATYTYIQTSSLAYSPTRWLKLAAGDIDNS